MIKYDVNLLQKVLDDFKDWRYQIDSQARKIFSLCENAVNALEQEIKVVEQQISMLNSELTLATNAIRINNDTKSKARSQITSIKQEISQLKKEISNINSQKSSAESSSAKSNLEAQKSSLNDAINSSQNQIEELEKKIAKVDSNNAKLEQIKSTIREELQKCHDHQDELNSEKTEMEAVYKSFRNYLVPQIMALIDMEIIPKMEETISRGSNLAKGLIILADKGYYNYSSIDVDIDSGISFQNMANKMQKSIDELKNYVSRCDNSTKMFSNNLNDRVSKYASNTVENTSYSIKSIAQDYFLDSVSKMRDVYKLCKEYEEITVDVNI